MAGSSVSFVKELTEAEAQGNVRSGVALRSAAQGLCGPLLFQRQIQTSGDIGRFWKEGYPAVKAQLRGRHPKHEWW